MSDFIIQIGDKVDPHQIAQKLQDRPGMKDRPARIWRFKWGFAVVQPPPGRGYEPFEENGAVYICTGHPRIIGFDHEENGPARFCSKFAKSWTKDGLGGMLDSLTGMYVLATFGPDRISIVTDLLGSQPVYNATNTSKSALCIGTFADIVADATGQSTELDLVSMSEFIVFDQITFPYTTYRQIREIEPAAVHTWRISEGAVQEEMQEYWQPVEPDVWPNRETITIELSKAIKSASKELSRSAKRLAVTLSGGRDSRAVLSALAPHGVETALTYCTRENRETDTAAKVARKAGVRHILIRRDPHFYGKLLRRTMNLLGSEVRGVAHGFAIIDAGMEEQFDVIVGGYLSDTLLKDHFMPDSHRERFRTKSFRERLRRLVARQNLTKDNSKCRWAASLGLLNPKLETRLLNDGGIG